MIPNKCQGIIKNHIFQTENIFRSNLQVQVLAAISLKQSVANYCRAPYLFILIGKLKKPNVVCLTLDFSPGEWLLTLLNIFVPSTNRASFYSLFKDFIMEVIIKDNYMQSNDNIKFEKSIEFGGIA